MEVASPPAREFDSEAAFQAIERKWGAPRKTPTKYLAIWRTEAGRELALQRDQESARVWISAQPPPGDWQRQEYRPGRSRHSHLKANAPTLAGDQAWKVVVPNAASLQILLNWYAGIGSAGGVRAAPDLALRLVTAADESRRGYQTWLQVLTAGALPVGVHRWWIASEDLVFEVVGDPGRPAKVRLGRDLSGESWIVEINPAASPGDANRLSAVARDTQGRPWLVRQGRLHPNGDTRSQISGLAFRAGTALQPVPVAVATGPVDREWFAVCRLDASAEEIVAATGNFVARCDLARQQQGPSPLPADELEVLQELLAGPETMGFLNRKARPAAAERRIWKEHAAVWTALHKALAQQGLKLEKPRHARGYEVDGFISLEPRPLLIEIKTDATANAIYTAVGQLTLYRQLLPSQRGCRPVLLLPANPPAPLARALAALEMDVGTYRRTSDDPEDPQFVFSEDFKTLCGL